jgi:hypothetical protein
MVATEASLKRQQRGAHAGDCRHSTRHCVHGRATQIAAVEIVRAQASRGDLGRCRIGRVSAHVQEPSADGTVQQPSVEVWKA